MRRNKIAILICGAYRTFDYCLPNLQKAFSEFDVDYYGCFWDKTLRFNQPENNIPEKIYPENIIVPEYVNIDIIQHLFKKIHIEPFNDSGLTNAHLFYYTFCKGLELINNPNEYDYIFKIRPDMIFLNDYIIPVEVISYQLFYHREGWLGMNTNEKYINDWCFGFQPKHYNSFKNIFNNIPNLQSLDSNFEIGVEYILRRTVYYIHEITHYEYDAGKMLVR